MAFLFSCLFSKVLRFVAHYFGAGIMTVSGMNRLAQLINSGGSSSSRGGSGSCSSGSGSGNSSGR